MKQEKDKIKKYQVVYEENNYFDENYGPYGYRKVGIKIDNRIIWLYTQSCGGTDKFLKWEKEASFIVDACNDKNENE
jgi:hypothetical protein